MPRLLLTGFEPFGDFADNPSWSALERARSLGYFDGLSVELARMPVTYAGTFDAFATACEQARPEVCVSFGVHGGMRGRGAATLYLETTARNRDDVSKPDNRGEVRREQVILADAPPELPATLPWPRVLPKLLAAGFEAALSDNAGAYLCNHLFFRAARLFENRVPYGFVHVPPVAGAGGVLPLDDLARAVALIAREAAGIS